MKELLQQLLGICFDKKLIMDLNADLGCVNVYSIKNNEHVFKAADYTFTEESLKELIKKVEEYQPWITKD